VKGEITPPNGARHLSPGYLQEILRLAIPAMLAVASEPLLSIVDTAMIGRPGVEKLAAHALGAAVIGGIYWLFTVWIFGTTTLVGYPESDQGWDPALARSANSSCRSPSY
jgi:MATE family multidrug resistance protein